MSEAEVMEEQTKQVVEYNVTDAAIEELAKRSDETVAAMANVDIGTSADYEMVKAVEAPIRKLRVQVESKRKELKADALAWGRLVDTEAKRITAALKKAEDPAKALRLKWDAEKDRIKAEIAAREKAHMDYILAAVDWLRMEPAKLISMSIDELEAGIENYKAIDLGESWEGFQAQAVAAHEHLMTVASDTIAARKQAISEAAERKAEAERLEAERAKLAAEQAEAKRIADKERAEIEQARQKLLAEQAEVQAAIDKASAEFEAKCAAEQAEKDRIAREQQIRAQAEADAKAAAERAEAEKREREKQAEIDLARVEELRPDKEKLAAYIAAIDAASKNKPNLEHNDSDVILARWELEIYALLAAWSKELEVAA